MKRAWLKTVQAALALLLAFTTVPAAAVQAEDGNADFEKFMNSEFAAAMGKDLMTMHFTVRDYAKYGITKPEANIGTATMQDYQDNIDTAQASLDALAKYDYNSLSTEQQYDYDVYKNSLNNTIALNSYPMFDFWFNPGEGLTANLLTNFTEYIFYEKQDIDDYLGMLASVPDYFSQALDLTRQQAAKGYFITDGALNDTEDAIDKFVAKTDDNELIVIFDENVDSFEGLSDAEKSAYKEKNKGIVLNSVVPAYENAKTVLESLRGSRTAGDSCSDLTDGAAYYLALARMKTSTDGSIEDMIGIGEQYLSMLIEEYKALYKKDPNAADKASSEAVSYTTPEDILGHLQQNLQDYPAGPDVSYKATYLDPSVANSSIVAYYMEPPLDDTKDNVIKINGDNVSDATELYGTLAHEGFPGHLYQITWYLNTNPNPLRATTSSIGYTEGWAMYVELASFATSGLSDSAAEINAINTGLGYVMDAIADLGVNGLGWTVAELGDQLDKLNLNSDYAQDLYDFVTKNPGQILPYGIGLAQFEILKKKAEDALGGKFNLEKFNEVLLANGDRPFSIVSKDVDAYIASAKGTAAATSTGANSSYTTYLLIGGLAVIAVIAIAALRKYHKDDPLAK